MPGVDQRALAARADEEGARPRPAASASRRGPAAAAGRPTSASSRSRDRARCAPRLSRTRAWISSTITVRVVDSIARPESEVSRRYRDSGVVTRMCGGCFAIAVRSDGRGVSGADEHAQLGQRRVQRRGSPPAAPAGSSGCRWTGRGAARRRRPGSAARGRRPAGTASRWRRGSRPASCPSRWGRRSGRSGRRG